MRRAIGKGLSQLVAADLVETATELPLASIVPNERQPRRIFDQGALEDLANSIKEYGVIQPIVVRAMENGRYELIAGERRWRASKLAGLDRVPVTVRPASNEASLELALVENIQREDINAMECARAYKRLADEFGLTQDQIAKKVGKSRVAITNTLRLLKLPAQIRDAVDAGTISEGHARALLGFENDLQMIAVFKQVLEQGLSVKEVEQRASSSPKSAGRKTPSRTPVEQDPNLAVVEEALSTYFGSPSRVRRGRVGGELTVQFYSDDDLERILERLGLSW
jgi:ParB family transcriptional regulator, chromosome partitioning protein